MKIEEALYALREGKQIRHPFFEEGINLQISYYSSIPDSTRLKEPMSLTGETRISFVKDNFEHKSNLINISLLVCDKWEIVNEADKN